MQVASPDRQQDVQFSLGVFVYSSALGSSAFGSHFVLIVAMISKLCVLVVASSNLEYKHHVPDFALIYNKYFVYLFL